MTWNCKMFSLNSPPVYVLSAWLSVSTQTSVCLFFTKILNVKMYLLSKILCSEGADKIGRKFFEGSVHFYLEIISSQNSFTKCNIYILAVYVDTLFFLWYSEDQFGFSTNSLMSQVFQLVIQWSPFLYHLSPFFFPVMEWPNQEKQNVFMF